MIPNPELMRLVAEQQRRDQIRASELYQLLPPKSPRTMRLRLSFFALWRRALWLVGGLMTATGHRLQKLAEPAPTTKLPALSKVEGNCC